ncbi:hypothetical protein JW930_01920 [Candidatus Woesearchaeota archaeon]|nr:hypothetical protein [Candidatus Woesearchaeota archaeon]
MIEVFSFKENNIVQGELKELNRELSWIRVISPNKETIEAVSENIGIPIEELEEPLEEDERPKISSGKYLEIIYRAPYIENQEVKTYPIYLYLFQDKLISVEKEPYQILSNISLLMEKNKAKFLFKKRLAYFVFYILDKINDDYLAKIDKIAANIDVYEEVTKKTLTKRDFENIYEQSVTLSFFNHALIANLEVLNALRKGYFKQISPRDKRYFEELYYDALQILDTEKIQREAISNLFNLQSVISANRLNEFIKKLTTIALIVAIPTMISGIYGMNFKSIPLAQHEHGFWITLGIMLTITVTLYIYFKNSDWL